MTNEDYGLITPPSTSASASFIALKRQDGDRHDDPAPIIGRLVYFDTQVGGQIFRSIGTVTDVTTSNDTFSKQFQNFMSKGTGDRNLGSDLRTSSVKIQAVFKKGPTGWEQEGAALPTSPATRSKVCVFDEGTVREMTKGTVYPSVGYFRGMAGAPFPTNTPNFDRSATHVGVLGRSGSGKTQGYSMILGTYMRHESHAIMVIDPQGQWSNEQGMIFSPQNMARNLGREVSVLKIAQDVRLPMDEDTLGRMIEKLEPWKRFQRMGKENREAFSDEVARQFARLPYDDLNGDTKVILSAIFGSIALSSSALGRIYVAGDRQDSFRDNLKMLAGLPITFIDKDGTELDVTISSEQEADADATWDALLSVFRPLHSLFQNRNLSGGTRRPMGGRGGFLTEFFQVRSLTPDRPAPYLVLDMSPDITLHAHAGLDRGNADLGMQQMLDNDDIKALMLQMLMREMKRASETAFASGEGLLNTQIVFDEAWRYAPERSSTPEINELASMLEGFALDTRKFGIGWTYILQTPADLRTGIWRQLTYVFAGYGLVGDDVRRLETLTDDPTQMNLYRQFISPLSTRVYPFVALGPISPLIFTTAPSFFNAFNGTEEFLEHNSHWIDEITTRRQLPKVTVAAMKQPIGVSKVVKSDDSAHPVKAHKPAKNYQTSKPQMPTRRPTAEENLENLLEKVPELNHTDDVFGADPF